MTTIKAFTVVAAGAFALSAAALASPGAAQTPYGSSQYPQQQQQQPSQSSQVLEALFGAVFGNNQSLESEWGRGRRPLFNNRANFEARLDAGVRDRSLSYNQSSRLRSDYDQLVQLETRYAADGRITTQERADLTARYRELTQRLEGGDPYGDDDNGYDSWRPLADSRASFNGRLDSGVRNRTLTRTQANRLATDFDALLQLEAGYQRNGLDSREQQDLESRWAELNRRVGDNYDDGYGSDDGYGNSNGDYSRTISDIEARIASGERSGSIIRSEAERLRTELGDLTRLDAAYRENGVNTDERAYLTRRFGELDQRVRNTRR